MSFVATDITQMEASYSLKLCQTQFVVGHPALRGVRMAGPRNQTPTEILKSFSRSIPLARVLCRTRIATCSLKSSRT